MTVASQTSRADYTGNGATTNFAVPYYFLDNTHLLVLRTDRSTMPVTVDTLVLGSDYTVAGAGNPAGGSVTLSVAPSAQMDLAILRNVPFTQLTHYVQNDPFPADSHERALDKLTMEVQQLSEENDRALTLPPNLPPGASTELPTPEPLALIGWNPDGNALQNVDPTTLATVVAFGTARADIFSGNGVTTAFSLTDNPGVQANLDVIVSGVGQRAGIDYIWSGGTTVTFTTAPPVGANNVQIRYFIGLPFQDSALRLDLATASDATLGDALYTVKRTVLNAIAASGHAWHEAQVLDANAEFGMSAAGTAAANTTALLTAIAAATILGRGQVEVAAGTYALTAGTNFAASNVAIVGRGQVIFDFPAGAGVGFKLDGVAAYIQGMRIENIMFRGNPSITDVFSSRRVIRSMFRNLEARECTTNGFALRHAVLNTYDHCIVSDDVGLMTTRPANYWGLYDDGTVDNHTQANVFLNCEASGHGAGSTKTGWTLTNAILNVWFGGTSESLQIGVDITSDVCRMNAWHGFDMEDNQQYDVRLKGVSNNFYSSFAQSAGGGVVDNVSISTGMNCMFVGGYYRKVNLGASSADTGFMGVTFDDNAANGIQGTGRFKRYNCVTNTGGVGGAITGVLRDVLGVSVATTLSLSQNNTPAQTVVKNEATVTGRMVQMRGQITPTAAGTAGFSVAVTLDPSFPAKSTAAGLPVGTFMYVTTGGTYYSGVAVLNTTGVLVFRTNAATGNFGVNPAVTVANGDILTFVVEYPLE